MTVVISPTLPATNAPLTPSGWLRIALIAAVAGVVLALPVQLTLGERALDRAVEIEQASATHLVVAPEFFSRAEQRGGLVIGQLLLATGFGFVVAAVAIVLSRRSGVPDACWLQVTLGAAWAVTIVPAVLLPPLPPGVESSLGLGTRQALYLGAIALGLATYACSTALLQATRGWAQGVVAILPPAIGLGLAAALLPDQRTSGMMPAGALTEFRMASVAGQLLFWAGMGAMGYMLLRRVDRGRAA